MKAEDEKYVFETSMQRALNRETMSKETLNAETKKLFIESLSNYLDKDQLNTLRKIIREENEAYHKAKVNSITDEEIKKMFTTEHFSESNGRYYRERVDRITGARMFKNRLLNTNSHDNVNN